MSRVANTQVLPFGESVRYEPLKPNTHARPTADKQFLDGVVNIKDIVQSVYVMYIHIRWYMRIVCFMSISITS